MSKTADVFMPEKLLPVVDNIHSNQYSEVAMYGGRGSGKSQALAFFGISESYIDNGTILCAREIQKSIQDSIYSSLVSTIEDLGLADDFAITKTSITNLTTGAQFMFTGLKTNITTVKSINRLRVALVDEAENVSEFSWEILRPSIRYTDNTRIYVAFNPRFNTDPTYKMFVTEPSKNTLSIKVNFDDNAMFPESLERQRLAAFEKAKNTTNFDMYNWIWNGDFLRVSNSSILGQSLDYREFTIDESYGQPLIGIDWGFAQSRNVVVECYVKGRELYVYKCGIGAGVSVLDTPSWLIRHVPLVKEIVSYADCARPEIIDHVNRSLFQRNNPMINPVKKGAGSVEQGVTFLLSFDKIVINTKACETNQMYNDMISELNGYSYKVIDKNTPQEVVTNQIQKGSDDVADAIRYALESVIHKEQKQSFAFATG